MGLVQRAIEEAGIATISVTMAPDVTRRVRVPRAAAVAFPLGHPFGLPGEAIRQRKLLAWMLRQAAEIREPGTIVDFGDVSGRQPRPGGRSRF